MGPVSISLQLATMQVTILSDLWLKCRLIARWQDVEISRPILHSSDADPIPVLKDHSMVMLFLLLIEHDLLQCISRVDPGVKL